MNLLELSLLLLLLFVFSGAAAYSFLIKRRMSRAFSSLGVFLGCSLSPPLFLCRRAAMIGGEGGREGELCHCLSPSVCVSVCLCHLFLGFAFFFFCCFCRLTCALS